MHQFLRRISKIEDAIKPKKFAHPCFIQTTAQQHGLDGEVIYEETEEEAIQKHLILHPEDEGREFRVICRVFVSHNYDESKYDQ